MATLKALDGSPSQKGQKENILNILKFHYCHVKMYIFALKVSWLLIFFFFLTLSPARLSLQTDLIRQPWTITSLNEGTSKLVNLLQKVCILKKRRLAVKLLLIRNALVCSS